MSPTTTCTYEINTLLVTYSASFLKNSSLNTLKTIKLKQLAPVQGSESIQVPPTYWQRVIFLILRWKSTRYTKILTARLPAIILPQTNITTYFSASVERIIFYLSSEKWAGYFLLNDAANRFENSIYNVLLFFSSLVLRSILGNCQCTA